MVFVTVGRGGISEMIRNFAVPRRKLRAAVISRKSRP